MRGVFWLLLGDAVGSAELVALRLPDSGLGFGVAALALELGFSGEAFGVGFGVAASAVVLGFGVAALGVGFGVEALGVGFGVVASGALAALGFGFGLVGSLSFRADGLGLGLAVLALVGFGLGVSFWVAVSTESGANWG